MMNIYFAGSIRGRQSDISKYQALIEHLKQYGEILTEFVGNQQVGPEVMDDNSIRDRDIGLMEKSNLVVAETTTPSLGVGYELASAERLNLPVIVLHDPTNKQLSAMINGTKHFNCFEYHNLNEAESILDQQIPKLVK